MHFGKHPRKIHSLRSDCCSFLKDNNDECISLNLSTEVRCTGYLRITLTLKTHPEHRHFFKLYHINDKGKTSKEDYFEICHDIKPADREVELKFFGIKKATKAEALEFIKNTILTNEINEIYKGNSSVFFLNIEFLNHKGSIISSLSSELQVGNQGSDDLNIKSYAPKTICDSSIEITFVLHNNIKDENKCPVFEIQSHDQTYVKSFNRFNCPVKNVIVYILNLHDLNIDKFRGRLVSDSNKSEWVEFFIYNMIKERVKRKYLSNEEDHPNSKIPKYVNTPSTSGSNEENPCINDNVINNKKQFISDKLYKKMLCEIACCAHTYALSGSISDKQWKIMEKVPIVCILQDNLLNSPLHYSILNNKNNPAKYFLDVIIKYYPTEIDAVNNDGNTPLMLGVLYNSDLALIIQLISSGANIYLENSNRKSVFNLSIDMKNDEVFRILLDKAKQENQTSEKNIISWITNIIKQQYYEGFLILFQNFENVLTVKMLKEYLSDDEYALYNKYVQKILNPLNSINFQTPVAEHELDNINLSDLIGFECDLDLMND